MAASVNIQPTRAGHGEGLAEAGGRLGPAKHFLNAPAHPLTDRIAGMAGRPTVDCRSPIGGVLRHMRDHIVLA